MIIPTKQVSKVLLSAPVFGDGIIAMSSYSVVVADTNGQIITLVSSDDWKTAVAIKNVTVSNAISDLVAVVNVSDNLFALHSHLDDSPFSESRMVFEIVP